VKHIVLAAALASCVGLVPGFAQAASITIIEDASEIVTPAVTSDLAMLVITPNFDQVTVTGRITPNNSTTFFTNPVTPGTRSVVLTEPPGDPFGSRTSDFVTLIVGQISEDSTGLFQPIRIDLVSDLAAGFDAAVAGLPAGTPAILETGGSQVVSTQLNSGSFAITVQSDFTPVPEIPVPEPTSLLLVGAGVLGVTLLARQNRGA